MNYVRYPLIYGLLSEAVIAVALIGGIAFQEQLGFTHSMWFGYTVMLVAMTFIFVGVKRYRDVEKGGVIKFLPALGMGLAIVGVAAIGYGLVWEIYLALTNYTFMDAYIADETARLHTHGVTGAELAKKMAEFDWMRDVYRNPFARFAMTLMEILPVGLIVAPLSAAVLRNPRVLPAR